MSCDPHLRQETAMPKYTRKIHARTQIYFFSGLSWRCSSVTPTDTQFVSESCLRSQQNCLRDKYRVDRVQRSKESEKENKE